MRARPRTARPSNLATAAYHGGISTGAPIKRRLLCKLWACQVRDVSPFLAKNCLEYFEISFAAAKLNAVVVAINWRLTASEIAYIISDADAKVSIVGADFQGTIANNLGGFAPLTQIIAIGKHPPWQSYETWLGPADAADPLLQGNDQDICSQLYTSGTTGLPKGVLSTNANLFAVMGTVQSAWRIDSTSVNLVCMPLFQIAGCEWALAAHQLTCARARIRAADRSRLWQASTQPGCRNPFQEVAVALALPGSEPSGSPSQVAAGCASKRKPASGILVQKLQPSLSRQSWTDPLCRLPQISLRLPAPASRSHRGPFAHSWGWWKRKTARPHRPQTVLAG
jgi:hypothetical protein